MFPILYKNITAGTVPGHRGLGTLSDCISCECEQIKNDLYEVVFEYPITGIHAEELSVLRYIKIKPNPTDDPQLFYIDRINPVMNDKITVYCKHISYLLSGLMIASGTASSAAGACTLLQNSAPGYNITTDKTLSASFKITEPSSVRSWFGGKEGSFLDVFGPAEIKYNNFNIQFLLHAGQNRGETIRYGKNLLELSQEIDTSNLYTHVVCFYKNEDENVMVIGSKMPTGLVLDSEKTLILDMSSDYEETPTNQQLTDKATAYINSHNLTVPQNNITLDFVQSEQLSNRVDLCDTVNIYYEALGITRENVKCIRTKYDCIREKYIETEFGDATSDLADSIIETNKAIEKKPSVSYMEKAIMNATQLITGNLGGYVILHDSNNDGKPDEILIMDTEDINTATNVWRFNQNGLGHSTSYDGNYALALTRDGQIVADRVTTGSMSANRVRTGQLISQNNQLILDLDNGTITAPSITLNGEDVGDRLAELEQVSVVTRYALSNSGTVTPSTFPLTEPTQPTESQPYLWSRTIYTYADGQSNTSYSISVRGSKGADGEDGKSFTVKGSYDTMAELIAAHPTGEEGDAYMVAGDLVVWDVDTNSWKDVGRIQGPSGFDGLWLAIENDDTGTNMNVTYQARLYKGVTDVSNTYNAYFLWQMVKESGITEIAVNTSTCTIARDEADYGGTIRCICLATLDDEVLQDFSYETIQDYTGNDITIISSNAIKLIADSAIYKPYAISSQFQVLQNEISSKVSQTSFNSLSNTVTQQGTLIQQNANQILLKADTTTVNAGLADKMGKDMSNRSSSILIDSGQIRFDSNSLVVNSSQFTLDASGNATFGGNLTAATLTIGGSAVRIGTAIDNAEDNAVATAAQDATNKANAAVNTASQDATNKADTAKNQAIATASQDASTKAETAKNQAISAASADATTKANNAAKTATNYITKIDNNGIFISPESQNPTTSAQGNSVLINGSGMNVYKGSLSVASFGDTARIGKADNSRIMINATSIQAYNSSNVKYFEVSASGITYGSNTVASTAYADGKASTAQANAKNYTDSTATSTLNSAKDYADDVGDEAESYADGVANTAKQQAISAASSDATTKANNAAKTATNYITKIDANGLFISPESQNPTTSSQGNSVLINASGMNVYKGNTSIAEFGDTARVGKSNSTRFVMNATSLQAYNSSNTKYFEVSANSITYGSNTVASTAYADQSEADAVATAKTYTDSGLSGKVGNSEVRTKFAADNTSVSITSGTIAFNSNTLTVDSTNFKLTANGSATATDFNAKTQLNLVDSSNNVKARLEHTGGTGGTRYRLYDTNSNALVDMWAYNGSGSLNLNDSSGNQLVGLGANGSSFAKNIYLKNASGTTRAVLYVDSYDHGNLYLYDESGTAKVAAYGSGEVNAVKFRQTGGLTSLYNGSMTSGSTTFSAAYSAFVIVGSVKSGGSKVTATIPIAMLSSSDTGFQIADNDDYVSFKLKVSGTTATMTFSNRSSTGAIERVFGML